MRLVLIPDEKGHLVLSAEAGLHGFHEGLLVNLSFLEEDFPHARHLGYTWADMLYGEPDGGRANLLAWAVKHAGRETPRGEVVSRLTAARAALILAARHLREFEIEFTPLPKKKKGA